MMVFLDALTLNKPEISIGGCAAKIDDKTGALKDEATSKFIVQQLEAFEVHRASWRQAVRWRKLTQLRTPCLIGTSAQGVTGRPHSGGKSVLKHISMAVAVLAYIAGWPASAPAQEWPQRPIRIIVAFGAGGGADIISRILGQSMQEKLGQAVVIENRPGAGGTIGNEAVARADKDGYTLGMMTAGQIIAATTKKSLRYDTLTDFDPVSLVATASLLIVARSDFPANTIQDLVAAAKAEPNKIVFASSGFGATQHFSAELFMQAAGVKMLHVPFRNSPEAIASVLGKQVDVLFDTVSALIGQVQSGELKALAVTGKDRFPTVPNVPTVSEAGVVPGYDVTTWYGVFAPRGTPPAVIGKLNKVLNEILSEDAVRQRLTAAGVVVEGSTPEAFGRFMATEFARWNAVREAAGIEQK